MKTIKLKHISSGPVVSIAAWCGVANYVLQFLTGKVILGPSSSMVDFLLRYGVGLLIGVLVNALLWSIVAAVIMGFVNFVLKRSGGLAFDFETGQDPAPKASSAPLPQFTPPSSDPPDPRQRRTQAEQALDAQSKLLRR